MNYGWGTKCKGRPVAEEGFEAIDRGQNMPRVSSEGGHFVLDPEGSPWGLVSKGQYGHIGVS